jgi:hypothetical protein
MLRGSRQAPSPTLKMTATGRKPLQHPASKQRPEAKPDTAVYASDGSPAQLPPLEEFLVERRIDVPLLIGAACGPRAQGRQNGGRVAGSDVAIAGAAAGGRGR